MKSFSLTVRIQYQGQCCREREKKTRLFITVNGSKRAKSVVMYTTHSLESTGYFTTKYSSLEQGEGFLFITRERECVCVKVCVRVGEKCILSMTLSFNATMYRRASEHVYQ